MQNERRIELMTERQQLEKRVRQCDEMMQNTCRAREQNHRASLNRLIDAARDLLLEYDAEQDNEYLQFRRQRDEARQRLEHVNAELGEGGE